MANSHIISGEVNLDEIGAGSIAIMEWLKAHNSPVCDKVTFNGPRGNCIGIVSTVEQEDIIVNSEEMVWRWFKEDCGRAVLWDGAWLLKVNNQYYLLTV